MMPSSTFKIVFFVVFKILNQKNSSRKCWHAKYTNIVVLLHISGKPGDVTGTGGNYGSMAPGVRPSDDNRRKFLFVFYF